MSLYGDEPEYDDYEGMVVQAAYEADLERQYDAWCQHQEEEAERWFCEELPEYESYQASD